MPQESPAPRGAAPPPRRPRFQVGLAWIFLALVLLAINVYAGTRAMQPASRRTRSVQSVLSRSGERGSRQGRSRRRGRQSKARSRSRSRMRARRRRPSFRPRSPHLPTTPPCQRFSSARESWSMPNHWIPGVVVAEPVIGLRADDLVRGTAVLADSAGRKYAEHSRLVRPLARTPVSAIG